MNILSRITSPLSIGILLLMSFFSFFKNKSAETKQEGKPTRTTQQGTDSTYHVNDLLIQFPEQEKDELYLLMNSEENLKFLQENPILKKQVDGVEGCFVLENVITPQECKLFVEISEKMGYKPSPLSVLAGKFDTSVINNSTKQIRDSERILTDLPEKVIEVLNKRIEHLLPEKVDIYGEEWTLRKNTPINERIRFNKYGVTQKFGPHMDAGYRKNDHEMTQLTIVFYLNEDFKGGETTFFPGGRRHLLEEATVQEVRIVPKIGLVSVFFQNGKLNHRHEGSPVIEGFKYIIRSDIAYIKSSWLESQNQ